MQGKSRRNYKTQKDDGHASVGSGHTSQLIVQTAGLACKEYISNEQYSSTEKITSYWSWSFKANLTTKIVFEVVYVFWLSSSSETLVPLMLCFLEFKPSQNNTTKKGVRNIRLFTHWNMGCAHSPSWSGLVQGLVTSFECFTVQKIMVCCYQSLIEKISLSHNFGRSKLVLLLCGWCPVNTGGSTLC